LIAVVTGAKELQPGTQELFWILPDGTWLRESSMLVEIVRPRLAYAEALLAALGRTLIETLNDIVSGKRGVPPNFEGAATAE
jgi:hypothetical protein